MEVMPNIHSALSDWKSMRTRLTSAVMAYSFACNTLLDLCAHSSDKPAVERTRLAIDQEIRTLEEEEHLLHNLRMSVGKLRNRSTSLIPINSLPSEILARVFAFTGTHYCLQEFNRPHGIPRELPYSHGAVCYHWRKFILNTPELWWHIDIGPQVPLGVTELLLERAQSSNIYVHACGLTVEIYGRLGYERTSWCNETWLINKLAPYVDRIYAIGLICEFGSGEVLIDKMLGFWLNHGNKHLSRFLSISQCDVTKSVLGPEVHSSESAQLMLQTLSGLRMYHLAPTWDISLCSGLVELEIDLRPHGHDNLTGQATKGYIISTYDLTRVLAASPSIKVLVLLGNVEIVQTAGWCPSTPTPLEHLRVLNIQLPEDSLEQLLLLARLPRFPSDLSVCLQIHSEEIGGTLSSFLSGFPVTTLHLIGNYFQCPSLPVLFPFLRILAFEHLDPFEEAPGTKDLIASGLNAFGARQTQLILVDGPCSGEIAGKFASRTGIQNVRLDYSQNSIQYFNSQPSIWARAREYLLENHPGVDCRMTTNFIRGQAYYRDNRRR